MAKPLAPEVRSQFAMRLKEMRVQAGYLRARYFAKALGIEENRYTRYERAEVEPNLTLIHKMCEILRVSPNELLGFAEIEVPGVGGFREHGPRTQSGRRPPKDRALEVPPLDGLAWRLAEAVAEARVRSSSGGNGAKDPLAATRETGQLYNALNSDPFGVVAGIAADCRLKDLDSECKAEIAELIKAYTEAVARPAHARLHAER